MLLHPVRLILNYTEDFVILIPLTSLIIFISIHLVQLPVIDSEPARYFQ